MIDIPNNGSITESAEVIVKRYEEQIKERLAEKDILSVAVNVYSIITLWGLSFEKVTGFDDPYDYLEARLGLSKSKINVYYRIGRILEDYRGDLKDIDLAKIASPYMLLYLRRADRNHYWHDVEEALKSMSYRQFAYFSKQYTRLSEPGKSSEKQRQGSTESVMTKEDYEQYKLRLRKGFDDDMEVLIVGLRDDESWKTVVTKLRRAQLKAIPAPKIQSGEVKTERVNIEESA